MTKHKPPLKTDDKHIAGVKRIDATPEAIGRSLLTPKAREMREKARLKTRSPTQWVDQKREKPKR